MKHLLQISALFLVFAVVVSCGDNSTGPNHKKQGILKVTTKTRNAESQSSSYSITFSIDEHKTAKIGANDTIYIKNLSAGFYDIKLGGTAPSCTVSGDNPRGVNVTAGDTTSVTFTVNCGSGHVAGIKSVINSAIGNHAFPGAAVAIGHDTAAYTNGYGNYTYNSSSPSITAQTRFDLASLTKVIATTTAVMLLYDQGKISLDQKVAHYLPDFAQDGKKNVTIRELLSHSSGLKPDISLAGLSTRKGVIDRILAQKLTYQPGSKSVYSDLNFIVLMLVVNKITGRDFADYCEQNIFKPLGMNHTGFMTGNYNKNLFAPTATNLQGIVNDPTARLLGGVSGNAGLYSTAEDLAKFGEMYIHHGKVDGKQFLKASTIKLFTTNAGVPNSKRALGWMSMARATQGWCSCGKYFGPQSFGHRGYTGTCIWIDPQQNLFGFLLPNGTYPSGQDYINTIVPARKSFYNQLYISIIGR
jgi:CubicO group peptidase (beta-lactamase class C family)